MRKIKKKKKRNELNEGKIEKESIVKRIFNFFKRKKEKIPLKSLFNATLIPIKEYEFIKNEG